MADLKFKPLDHPSDVGIIAFGKNLKELFENAAFGMFSTMAEMAAVETKISIQLRVTGEDREALLVNWLNELIYHEDAKKLLLNEFTITKISETELEAVARGEKIDPSRHFFYRPIKAATYNQLQIKENQATIIFDV